MHDWEKAEAQRAATERHTRMLRSHSGYPQSDGQALSMLCACGMRSPSVTAWESHLAAVMGSTIQKQ